MAYDLTLRNALRELVNGNAEPLAELVELGYTGNLHETLQHYPEARKKMAKAIRTGKPLERREHPWERHLLDQRDWYLCGRVAYWIGRGMDDRWQDEKNVPDGATVWHYAASEWPENPSDGWPDVPRPAVSSLQKIWQATIRTPDSFRLLNMTHEFCLGVEHELPDIDDAVGFISHQLSKADRLGLMDSIYSKELSAALLKT
ncbi:hypothetical protein [Halomonas sp. Mc5H-6]|uniref:hypothetical protein n=1 Tax=Halomonas sp. Mc5H-6 TaxID=2954500 RepID=UPI0020977681|nr:hypothetical protein [Halomonas sp. Mc5H-6]MCO7245251.1 hypothetical protein [Halomonas sp. Mc5H-6]